MSKLIFKTLSIFAALSMFVFVGQVSAAGSLSVRLEQPKSPTNLDSFQLVFVTLDIQGRPVMAKCFKKGPSEGSFSQFGGDFSFSGGGNTGNCPINSSIVNTNGTYQFYVTSQAGADNVTSSTVSVEYKTGGPDTPTSYSKEKISSCTYRIKFKTADDGGKTVKVELYRSDSTSFSVDSGTRVDSISIGSNSEGQFENTVPDCGKTYYFVIRAFDSSGNGSGTVGDSTVTIITTTVSPTPVQGAIPVAAGPGGAGGTGGEAVLGEKAKEGEKPGGEVEGATISGEVVSIAPETPTGGIVGRSYLPRLLQGLAIIAVLFAAYKIFRRFKK